jgi:hypothetical protein
MSHQSHIPDAADDDEGYEGPDIEMPLNDDTAGTAHAKPDGLGEDGTIPSEPEGVAAGHTGVASTFEPEEDEQAGT